jgi:pilus retraction protein PilT
MDTRVLLDNCLKIMVENGASDLHIKSDAAPRMRVSGKIKKMDHAPLSQEDVNAIAQYVMNDYHRERLPKYKGVDLAFQSETYGRYRANIFYQRGMLSIVIRTIKSIIPGFAELHIPSVFEKICMKERGLILIAGATSSGKSTTVASMVDYINKNRDAHMITVEDPIEYMHQDNRCVINQREIGQDSTSFSDALKFVVRQDPDVIIIGEMRDPQSFKSAIAASETGHLVVSTIHAKNVLQVFDRILGFFPSDQHEQVLVQLSFNLQAIAAQRLLPKKDGSGLIPAFEVLLENSSISKLVRENNLDKLTQAMINGQEDGMQTFNMALIELYNSEQISKEEALMASDNAHSLEMNMKGIYLDDTSGGILDR